MGGGRGGDWWSVDGGCIGDCAYNNGDNSHDERFIDFMGRVITFCDASMPKI